MIQKYTIRGEMNLQKGKKTLQKAAKGLYINKNVKLNRFRMLFTEIIGRTIL